MMKRCQNESTPLRNHRTLTALRRRVSPLFVLFFLSAGLAGGQNLETESNNFFLRADTLKPGTPLNAAFTAHDRVDVFVVYAQNTSLYQSNLFCDWTKYDLSAVKADVFSADDTSRSVLFGNPSGRYGKFGFRLAGWQPPKTGWYFLKLQYPADTPLADSLKYQVRFTGGTPVTVAGFHHEPDNTAAEAKNLAAVPTDGAMVHGYLFKKQGIYNWNDMDLYWFYGTKDYSLTAETFTAARLTDEPWFIRDADTEIALLDQNGQELGLINDDKETTAADPWETTVGFNNTFSRIQVDALPYTGPYYVRVNSFYNSITRTEKPEVSDTNPGGGEYLLSVRLTRNSRAAVHFDIVNQADGLPLPGKMTAIGVTGTPTEGVYKFLHTAAARGKLILPAGAYTLAFTHGPEYTMVEQPVVLAEGDSIHTTVSLQRIVDTEGYLCGDLHMHALEGIAEQDKFGIMLNTLVAEGVEYAVATDHNAISDYRPRLLEMGLQDYIKTSPGDEISTGIGHINAWPLDTSGPAVISSGTATEMFNDARRKGAAIVQINHPRWPGIDYFTKMNLDPLSGIFAHPQASEAFDAMEIMNETNGWGFKYDPPNTPVSVLQDWFNLLNRGKRYCAVGNSDAHGINSDKPGYPRNYIAASTDKPGEVAESELLQSLRHSRVTVSLGHFTTFTINETAHIGDQITDTDGTVKLSIRVQALPQIPVDSVKVYANGIQVAEFSVAAAESAARFIRELELHPTRDTWYVVASTGNTPIPIGLIQDNSGPVTPIGLTNPIWVDVDGDGIFLASNSSTAVETGSTRQPDAFALEQNYPNPFNPSTTFAFSLAHSAQVRITAFDVLGKVVAVLKDERMAAGAHKLVWDAQGVANGVYFIKMEAGTFHQTRKAVLMK